MDFDNYMETQRLQNDMQEVLALNRCDECGAEIYKGSEYYSIEGYNLCEDCFDKMQEQEKNDHRLIAGEEYE